MDDELRSLIWQLCQFSQADFKKLADDVLTAAFKQAYSLQMILQNAEASPLEKQVVDNVVARMADEIHSRGIKISNLPVEVAISKEGKFIKGEKDLRKAFSFMSFEEMMEFIDSILAHPLNEAQRKALLDLAREKIYADSAV